MARNKPDDPFTDDDWGPSESDGSAGREEMPEGNVDPERTEFLKPRHMSAREGTLELISVSGATEYSDCVLHVRVGTRGFRLGLRTFDPSYVALRKHFGGKREDWHGTLRYRVMPHKGKPDGFVAVRPMR